MQASDRQQYRAQLYEAFAAVGHALGHPRRVALVELLAQAPRAVEELAAETQISIASCSQHLHVLRAAGLVSSERSGLYTVYALASGGVYQLYVALRQVAGQNAPVLSTVTKYPGMAVTARELLDRLNAGGTVLLDVRPGIEYRSGHIPGARSMPLETLAGEIHRLRSDHEIVAYCRGPHCLMADQAVSLLTQAGYRAHRLDSGYMDWKLAGLPVAEMPPPPRARGRRATANDRAAQCG